MKHFAPIVAIASLLVGAAGCGDGERARNEAHLFLDRFEGMDIETPHDERERRTAELRALVLVHEDVARTRNACVDAHEALLRAENEHERASAELLEASAGNERAIPPEAAARIEAAIAASQSAIDSTRELFPRCEREVRALRTRFRPRRRSDG